MVSPSGCFSFCRVESPGSLIDTPGCYQKRKQLEAFLNRQSYFISFHQDIEQHVTAGQSEISPYEDRLVFFSNWTFIASPCFSHVTVRNSFCQRYPVRFVADFYQSLRHSHGSRHDESDDEPWQWQSVGVCLRLVAMETVLPVPPAGGWSHQGLQAEVLPGKHQSSRLPEAGKNHYNYLHTKTLQIM